MCKQRRTCRLLTCSATAAACGRKTRRCVGVEGGRVRGDSCGRVGRRGFQRGREWGAAGFFCTVRRTLDSDKRSIQPSFNPLVQSRRDKRNPQKQIRLLRPETTAETKSQAVVFVCRAGVLQPCRNDWGGVYIHIYIYILQTQDSSPPPSLIEIQSWKKTAQSVKKNNMSHRHPTWVRWKTWEISDAFIVCDQDKHWRPEWKHVEDFSLSPDGAVWLSAVHADGLRRCPSSDLLIQSGWASHHKTFRVFSRRLFLTFWQSAQPMETLSFIYIHWLASSPNSQTITVKSVWEMRMWSPLSASTEWQKSWSGAFSKRTYFLSLSHFLYQKPFFLQAESFTIPTRSCQSKHQLQEKFLWNAIKEIPPRQREREKGVRGAVWNGEWRSLPPFLPFSLARSVTLSSLPTSPDRSAIAQLFENTANHSMAANGERMRQDLSLSCTANIHCII